MANLSHITFKDFITLQRGFDLPKKDIVDGHHPVVGSTSIIGYHREYKVLPPGVVTGRSGSLGEVQYIQNKYWPHNTSLWVRDFKGNDPRYVYYFLKTIDLKRFNSGAGVPTLNRNDLDTLEVVIHDFSTQHKIASILSAYDDLIENNTRRIKILEEMAQAIYQEWFVKFRFPWHEKIKMVDSEMGKIPAGWEVKRLGDVVETQYGYTESATEKQIGPRFLRGTDINKTSYIKWDNVPFCKISEENFDRYRLKKGDILIIRMADPGKVGIIERNVEAVFGSYLIRLKIISDRITPYYLFYFMQSDKYQNYITGASTGTTRKSVSAGTVTDIDIPIPPVFLLTEFETQISLLREQLNIFLEKNSILRRTRNLLLPKLISGEIDVESLEIKIKELEV